MTRRLTTFASIHAATMAHLSTRLFSYLKPRHVSHTALPVEALRPDAVSPERSVVSRIDGKKYEITSDDNYLDHIQGEFEPDVVALFKSLTREAKCVFDVGANIGCTSILFGQRADMVYSFEPSPTTFRFLEKNIARARLRNVRPVNIGLGRASSEHSLTYAANNRSGGFVSNKIKASEGHRIEKVSIVRGDEFTRQQGVGRIDFIKIDVEGFERDVLEGLGDTIARCRPAVALELNHWCLNAFQRTSVPDFFDFLRGIFPFLYAIDKDDARSLHDANHAYHVMYHHIVNDFAYPNLVGAFDKGQLRDFASKYRVIL